jgi:hypothetical protein
VRPFRYQAAQITRQILMLFTLAAFLIRVKFFSDGKVKFLASRDWIKANKTERIYSRKL